MSQGQRLADKVGVLLDGGIVQTGDWQGVFNTPRDRKVAAFVGVENIIDGTIASNENDMVAIDIGGNIIEAIADYPVGEKVSACIRPEDITLTLLKTYSSARNSFAGKVSRVISAGALSRVELDCSFPLVCLVTKKSAEELNLESGKQVYASFKATGIHVIRRELT
jgi:molybdopterin-binding protein